MHKVSRAQGSRPDLAEVRQTLPYQCHALQEVRLLETHGRGFKVAILASAFVNVVIRALLSRRLR
jgi:hypothetical protein